MALFEDIGIAVLRFFDFIGGLVMLLVDTLGWIVRGAIKWVLTIQQMAVLGVSSIPIVVITTGFAGAVMSLQLADQAVKHGLTQFVGMGVALTMLREFAPMLTAIVVAGRAGSAITAELGSMKVTEQIDALQALAISPVKQLVVPRFLAMLGMFPILTLFAMVAGCGGGALVALAKSGISYHIFFDSIRQNVMVGDMWMGLEKSLFFATEISMIACYQGLNTSGGAAGVGQATTGSVVFSILVIFASNYFLSAWMFPS